MPTLPVNVGVTRQAWFAPVANPATKNSFLTTDHAFTRREEQFGRQVRLGNPVNLGPNSAWAQLSWEGGVKQELWSDIAMFQEGSVDVQSRAGKARMWSGWRALGKTGGRWFERYTFGRSGLGNGTDTPLYFAESDVWKTVPPLGGYQIFQYGLGGGTNIKPLVGGPVGGTLSPKAILAMNADNQAQNSTWLAITTLTQMWIFDEVAGTFTRDTGAFSGPYQPDGIVNFGAGIYYLSNNSLCKRLPGALGVIGQHSIIRTVQPAIWLRGMTVYNNRIYYGVQYHAGRAAVEFSDGVTAQRAFEFPEEFWLGGMVSHYGSLYIYGGKRTATGATPQPMLGQVWRYNGSSLVKLYEAGDPKDGQDHFIYGAATYNQNLVWGEHGYPGTPNPAAPSDIDPRSAAHTGSGSNSTLRPCLVFYDAEKDAIFKGPALHYDPANTAGILVNNVIAWDNTLVAGFRDMTANNNQMAAQVRQQSLVRDQIATVASGLGGGSFDFQWPTKSHFILSSRYHGEADVTLEKKTWLVAKLHVNLPANGARVRLAIILDEGVEQVVGTLANANGWQTWVLPLKVNGDYTQSVTLQYKLYLENTDSGNVNSTAIPEVDDVWVEWCLAPTARRSWRLRMFCQDGQARLDGVTPNPLTTKSAQVAALEGYYTTGKPVLFWGPQSDNVTPTVTGTEVRVTEFLETSYRVDDQSSTEMSEVSVTLVENVIT